MKQPQVENVHWFENFTTLIEQNILGVKIGIYGVGLLGLGIALKSVRPFKKFTSPSTIPQSFIEGNVKLRGKVLTVDFFPKTVLLVDHEPLLGGSLRRSAGLPVSIEGINISGNGISWLQSIVVGEKVDFIILQKHPEYASCLVFQKKRDIGNYLVSIGFASVAPYNASLEKFELYTKYYKDLLIAEETASRKGLGLWWDMPKKFSLIDFILPKLLVLKSKAVKLRTS